MKGMKMLVWLTQLGLSIAVPLAFFILLAVWLHNSLGWGNWVIWVGLILGVCSAISGFRKSLWTMERMSKEDTKQNAPPISFNEHS